VLYTGLDHNNEGVQLTDTNYGNHVGHDTVMGLLHEARVQWLMSVGLSNETHDRGTPAAGRGGGQ